MSCFMDRPWCPRCEWTPDHLMAALRQIDQPGRNQDEADSRIDCPVCGNPILVTVRLEPQYECRKGPGWKP